MTPEELDEMVKEIEELWDNSFIPREDIDKMTKGYKVHKIYEYGPFREIKLYVYTHKDNRREVLYVVQNASTGVYKLVTKSWSKAEALAKQLAQRYKALNSLFGWW